MNIIEDGKELIRRFECNIETIAELIKELEKQQNIINAAVDYYEDWPTTGKFFRLKEALAKLEDV